MVVVGWRKLGGVDWISGIDPKCGTAVEAFGLLAETAFGHGALGYMQARDEQEYCILHVML